MMINPHGMLIVAFHHYHRYYHNEMQVYQAMILYLFQTTRQIDEMKKSYFYFILINVSPIVYFFLH